MWVFPQAGVFVFRLRVLAEQAQGWFGGCLAAVGRGGWQGRQSAWSVDASRVVGGGGALNECRIETAPGPPTAKAVWSVREPAKLVAFGFGDRARPSMRWKLGQVARARS